MSSELSLVKACLEGEAGAWETFVSRYRGRVLAFALSLSKDEDVAEEMCSVVWAELCGVQGSASGRRVSKLAAYTGRGSLEGWLRTVAAQAYVDRYRKERRYVAFEDGSGACSRSWEPESAVEAADLRLEQALDRALAELSGEQRLILAAHYLDGRTFAEVGRMVGAHESSVHRQAGKSVALLRKRTAHHLRAAGMSMREAEEAMGGDVRGISLDVRKRLQLVKHTP